MNKIKNRLLSHEPFKPAHMGYWIRSHYFRHYVRSLIRRQNFVDVLDAGCGTGMYSRMLAIWLPHARIHAIDLLSLKEWKDAPENISFETLDLRHLDAHDRYDLVVTVDVLEHIPDNTDVIRRFARALRSGGYLYIAVPSETQEQHFLPRHLFSHFHEWEEHEHIGEQHTLAQLAEFVRSMGLDVCVARHTFTFFGTIAWEIEMALHWRGGSFGKRVRILLMPLLKTLGWLDIMLPIGTGNNLVIARKTIVS
jgi:SAM-dependent methyltransferase